MNTHRQAQSPRPPETPGFAMREFLRELTSEGLFEVSSGERFVEHMLDRIERRR